MFINCKSLKDIKLPSNITKIEYQMFKGCEGLEEITISNNIIEITLPFIGEQQDSESEKIAVVYKRTDGKFVETNISKY